MTFLNHGEAAYLLGQENTKGRPPFQRLPLQTNHIQLCFLCYSIPFVDSTVPASRSSNIVA